MFLKKKKIAVILSVFFVVLGYQNCSVYKSDGRQNLELLLNSGTKGSCLPFIDSNIAAIIMNDDVAAFLSLSPPAGSIAECRITAGSGTAPIDRVVCGMSNAYSAIANLGRDDAESIVRKSASEQIALLNQDPEDFIEVLEDYQSELSGGSFSYSYKVGDMVVLRFLGANQSSSVGVACYIVYPTTEAYEDTSTGRSEAHRRLSDLTHEIVEHL